MYKNTLFLEVADLFQFLQIHTPFPLWIWVLFNQLLQMLELVPVSLCFIYFSLSLLCYLSTFFMLDAQESDLYSVATDVACLITNCRAVAGLLIFLSLLSAFLNSIRISSWSMLRWLFIPIWVLRTFVAIRYWLHLNIAISTLIKMYEQQYCRTQRRR